MAKEFLSRKGIEFEEIDITKDPGGREELKKLTGRTGVPVIVIGGEIMVGWGPTRGDDIERKLSELRRKDSG